MQDGLKYTNIWNSVILQSKNTKKVMITGIGKKNPRFAKL